MEKNVLKKNLVYLLIILLTVIMGCEGATGPSGEDGFDGKDGSTWYVGEGIPSNLQGVNGDFYLDTETSKVYIKESDLWQEELTIKGETGENGNGWLVGEGPPDNSLGSDGDLYLETLTADVYIKENSEWGFLINISGKDGGYDRIIRLQFQNMHADNRAQIEWEYDESDGLLYRFNIEDYIGVDRVIFIGQFNRYLGGRSDSLGLRLYDYTNKTPIEMSEIWSTKTKEEYDNDPLNRVIESQDIYNSFPLQDITIGIQYRKQKNITEDRIIRIYNGELLLYRSSDIAAKIQINKLLQELEKSYE